MSVAGDLGQNVASNIVSGELRSLARLSRNPL